MESKGIQALSTVIRQPQNARVLHKALLKNYDENSDPYNMALSQVIGDILEGRSLKDVLTGIKSGKTAWSHESFDTSSRQFTEQDDFIENPFEVEEGVLECKCGSKRVFSYSKQTRGADEPMTTFAICVACNAKWTYSG
jgi:DNA-directed RNA polymerase subunit M/transcription elongation factor TFIIS